MRENRWGMPVTAASSDAIDAFDEALARFCEYRLDAGEHLKNALAADPAMPMALCMRGYMLMQLSTNAVAGKVDEAIAAAMPLTEYATEREQMHLDALRCWRDGRIADACARWRMIFEDEPRDLLALRLHHFMSFWRGDREALRDGPGIVLGRVDETMDGYAFVLGMHAFGLEECADYAQAEATGRAAVARNPEDLWAIHAVAHVMEMQARSQDGAAWLDHPVGTWADRNPFKDHVWWHAALFALDLGENGRVLDLYDREIRADEKGFYLDVQNAASLLMRLELIGLDVGDRWQPLADLAEKRIGDHVMAFTDLHFMMSLVGAGRTDTARRYLESLTRFAEIGTGDVATIAAELSGTVAAGLLAFGESRHADATDLLLSAIDRLAPVGGSHAQQDIFRQILIAAAIKAERNDIARDQLAARARLRPDDYFAAFMKKALAFDGAQSRR